MIEFSQLEKKLIHECVEYSKIHKVETARVIKNNKNITDKFDWFETENYVSEGPKDSYIFGFNFGFWGSILKCAMNLKNSVYIHSHLFELPLSRPDVYAMLKRGMKRMVAVTPSGRTSVIEFDGNKRKLLNNLSAFDEPKNLMEEFKRNGCENFLIYGDKFRQYQDCMKQAWNKFVELTNAKYESEI